MPEPTDNPYSAPSASLSRSPEIAAPELVTPQRYEPGGATATASFVLLLANAGISALTAIYWIVVWSRLSSQSFSAGWARSLLVQIVLLTVITVVLWILTAVFFSIWTFRAYRNLTALGNPRTTHGLWWAAAGFYIPVVNLFMPYLIGREIWLKSDPVNLRRGPGDRQLMPRNRTAGIVAGWWLTLVSAHLMARFASAGVDHGFFQRVGSLFFVLILTALLHTTAGVLGALLVRTVEKRQRHRHAALTSERTASDSGRSEPRV